MRPTLVLMTWWAFIVLGNAIAQPPAPIASPVYQRVDQYKRRLERAASLSDRLEAQRRIVAGESAKIIDRDSATPTCAAQEQGIKRMRVAAQTYAHLAIELERIADEMDKAKSSRILLGLPTRYGAMANKTDKWRQRTLTDLGELAVALRQARSGARRQKCTRSPAQPVVGPQAKPTNFARPVHIVVDNRTCAVSHFVSIEGRNYEVAAKSRRVITTPPTRATLCIASTNPACDQSRPRIAIMHEGLTIRPRCRGVN